MNNDNNNNADNNNNPMVTSPEEQKAREAAAEEKEHTAQRKSKEKFAELNNTMVINNNTGADSSETNNNTSSDELRHTVRLLVMAEQTDALTAVLTRLNGDRKSWEMAQREPVALIAMIIEEQQKRMEALQQQFLTAETKSKDKQNNSAEQNTS